MHTPRPKVANVDEYIAMFPQTVQKRLQHVRQLIVSTLPESREVISYAIPAYKMDERRPVIYFAGYEHHIGLYPVPKKLPKALEPYVAGKGTLRFEHVDPLPEELLRDVVRALVKERS